MSLKFRNRFCLMTILLLSACSHYQESSDCPIGQGLGCKSITEVKKKLNAGEIDIPTSSVDDVNISNPMISKPLMHTSLHPQAQQATRVDSQEFEIHRVLEKPVRIWFAPYQDHRGNLHEGSVVHTVLSPGFWHIQ